MPWASRETGAVQILLGAEQGGKQRLYRYFLVLNTEGNRLYRYFLVLNTEGNRLYRYFLVLSKEGNRGCTDTSWC